MVRKVHQTLRPYSPIKVSVVILPRVMDLRTRRPDTSSSSISSSSVGFSMKFTREMRWRRQ